MSTEAKERRVIGFRSIVLIALFSVLIIVVQLVSGLPFLATPRVMVFASTAIWVTLAGPLYVLMVKRAPYIGTAMLFATIQAVYMALIGQLLMGVFYVVGGIISELILYYDKRKSALGIGAAYGVFSLFYLTGTYVPYILLRERFAEQLLGSGYGTEMVGTMVEMFSSPIFVITTSVNSVVWAAVGTWVGYAILKKHFKPAGAA